MLEYPNGTFEAKMDFDDEGRFASDVCDTKREALASLALAMGLHEEMKVLVKVAPDAELWG
jgi:hypothetical protein